MKQYITILIQNFLLAVQCVAISCTRVSRLSKIVRLCQYKLQGMRGQEKSVEFAMRVWRMLNKQQKPFLDSEIVKECMLEVAIALFEEKKDIINAIRSIPLSAKSNTRRTEILADDFNNNLIYIL